MIDGLLLLLLLDSLMLLIGAVCIAHISIASITNGLMCVRLEVPVVSLIIRHYKQKFSCNIPLQ